ncbi:hypothetical protein MFMK1_003441 [Metallumcola ferriviriculae]|uniref:Uncharacterized protein n=1 Tax=Metallumcola ferriviriculae TaxID=3039180 RepID=A0AAU0USN1_9FIRM|nr:hypothetical protein MFMK1_003441 [Desulfitibacteraceae bacterium MK1]
MKKKMMLTFPASDTMPGPATYQALVDWDEYEDSFDIISTEDIDEQFGNGTAQDVSSTSQVPLTFGHANDDAD